MWDNEKYNPGLNVYFICVCLTISKNTHPIEERDRVKRILVSIKISCKENRYKDGL